MSPTARVPQLRAAALVELPAGILLVGMRGLASPRGCSSACCPAR